MQFAKSSLDFVNKGIFPIYRNSRKRKRAHMALHPATQFLNSSQTIRLPVFSAELAFIKNVEEKLASLNLPVSNKAVILAIIRHLEEESDPEKTRMYRSALEMVVSRTPDDL